MQANQKEACKCLKVMKPNSKDNQSQSANSIKATA